MEKKRGSIDVSDIKRLYADIQIEIKCPQCGEILNQDFNGDYLSYVEIGKRMTKDDYHVFYCENCEEKEEKVYEFKIPLRVCAAEIEIEFDPNNIKPA